MCGCQARLTLSEGEIICPGFKGNDECYPVDKLWTSYIFQVTWVEITNRRMKRVDGKLAESAHLLMPIESGSFRNITKQMSSLAATSHGSWPGILNQFISSSFKRLFFFCSTLGFLWKKMAHGILGALEVASNWQAEGGAAVTPVPW